jgi:hypothetical protein
MHCYDAAGPKSIFYRRGLQLTGRSNVSHVICINMCLIPCTLAIPATFLTLLSCWKSGYIFAGAPTRRRAVLFPDQFILVHEQLCFMFKSVCSFPWLFLKKIYPYSCRKWSPGRPTLRPSLYRLSYPDSWYGERFKQNKNTLTVSRTTPQCV